MIQLSLFPTRGYGIIGPPGIVENNYSGLPYFTTRRHEAVRVAEHLSWGYARVIRLERHDAVEGANGKPTYVVSELQV